MHRLPNILGLCCKLGAGGWWGRVGGGGGLGAGGRGGGLGAEGGLRFSSDIY